MLLERETPVMQRLWQEASGSSTSRLTVVEARTALVRAARTGRLRGAAFPAAKSAAARLLAEVNFVEPEPGVLLHAADLAERHGLRAYDSVHLASALEVRRVGVVVATWDNDLRAAALAEGLAIAA